MKCSISASNYAENYVNGQSSNEMHRCQLSSKKWERKAFSNSFPIIWNLFASSQPVLSFLVLLSLFGNLDILILGNVKSYSIPLSVWWGSQSFFFLLVIWFTLKLLLSLKRVRDILEKPHVYHNLVLPWL